MLIRIEFDSEVAIYEQLRRQIIIGIAKGELKAGDRLPSVRSLSEDLGINLHTVRKSYNILREEGYLTIDRRKGSLIRVSPSISRKDFESYLDYELSYLIAECKNRGISEDKFLRICSNYYHSFKEK